MLETGLALAPDGTAVVGPQRSWTWRALDAASTRYAGSLLAAGVRPGDRVASLLPEGESCVIHYLGCLRAGIVATPLNYRYTPPEIDHALRTSGARALLFHESRADDVQASALAGRLELGTIVDGAHGATTRLRDLLSAPASGPPLTGGGPDDAAVIFFTSGSTGPAKGVTHTVRSLEALIDTWADACAIVADDVVGAFASLSHVGGFQDLLVGLTRGATVVIPARNDPEHQRALIRAQRPTYGVFLSSNLFALIRDPATRAGDFSSFRILCASGDAVPAALRDELESLAAPPLNEAFGMTELGTATLSPLGSLPRAGSVGRAVAGYELEIRDRRGKVLPAGASGRLWVRSTAVMAGYWDDPDSTSRALVDGWLDTGDVFSRDADGYLWFQGREKQIIVHKGSNITPQEVEDALVLHPAVRLAGVVGVPDLLHGENVRAFVELRAGAVEPSASELIAFARERVGYKAPADVFVVRRMPLGPSGKIDRAELGRMSGRIGAVAPGPSASG